MTPIDHLNPPAIKHPSHIRKRRIHPPPFSTPSPLPRRKGSAEASGSISEHLEASGSIWKHLEGSERG